MATHLTISSAVAGTRTFGGQQASQQQATGEAGSALGIFASLLGNTTGADATAASQGAIEFEPGAFLALGLEAGLADTEGETGTDALDAADPPPTQNADPAPVLDLVEALNQIKLNLDAGKPLDPDLLEKASKALGDLANALGLDLDALPIPEDFAELLETRADDTGLAGALTQLLAPFSGSLAVASAADDAAGIAEEAAALGKLKDLGDKLAAMLAALEADTVPDEKLASIGMPPGQPALGEIDEALARFAAGLADVAVPEEPELAMPALKLTEPVLAGKNSDAADAPAPTPKTEATAEPAAEPEDKREQSSDQPSHRDRVEARREPANTNGFAAPAANDAAAADTAAPASQQASPRVDSASTTRAVVQPGYQTSQQQLNLPQIAFELARQVEGGNTRFQIRLDPPELGRIDVRLEIDHVGTVNARLTVEKSETLDLMQRDQRGLERALQQAGIDTGKTNLEFSLKQNPFAGQAGFDDRQQGRGTGNGLGGDDTTIAEEPADPTPTVNLYRGTLQARGVNIIA